MMEASVTVAINLDTPIHMLTPRQLFAMAQVWQQSNQPESSSQQAQPQKQERWYVNTVKELADILGTSESTVYRMKADGVLDDAISQYGRWMYIDVNKVLEIFRLSNRRKRKKKLG